MGRRSPHSIRTPFEIALRKVDDSLKKGTALDAVGYGVQAFVKPGEPDLNAVWTRYAAAPAKAWPFRSMFWRC